MLLSLVFLAVVVAGSTADQQAETARRALATANNAFSVDLYQALRTNPGNIVVSPLSADTLLSLVYLGAGGNTASQLKTALHLPDDAAQVSLGFKTLLNSLQSSGNTTSRIANKVYLQEGFHLKDDFKQTAVNSFGSDAAEADFAHNAEAARASINNWVEQQTDRKIKDLIAAGSLDPSTVMVLVNAIYFKGAWKEAFDESRTQPGTFHVSNDKEITVPFMHKTADFGYGILSSLNARVLELPYSDGEFKLLVLLPDGIDGLDTLEAGLGQINFTDISRQLSDIEVVVSLPKFKIESKFELHNTLPQLGVTDLFRTGANLTGITDQSVFVSQVVQKAFIEVTETGTVAAAATGIQIAPFSAGPPPIFFHANRPFLFVLMSKDDILFIGRVSKPEI